MLLITPFPLIIIAFIYLGYLIFNTGCFRLFRRIFWDFWFLFTNLFSI